MKVERREFRDKHRRQGVSAHRQRRRCALVSRPSPLDSPRGFTLTELLVVIVILAVLTTMTVYAVNFSMESERSRAGARQVQSYLSGARDRAIYERHPVGVRFLIDPIIEDSAGNKVAISSMVYVEEIDPPTGQAMVSQSGMISQISGDLLWTDLIELDLIVPGTRIKFTTVSSSRFYFVQGPLDLTDPNNPKIRQNIPMGLRIAPAPTADISGRYEIQLAPVVRPNQEPMLLPRGIVIDLARSQLPSNWTGDRRDIMFSPRGTMTGRAATSLIHFYLAEAADVERLANFPATATITLEFPHIPADVIPKNQLPDEPASANPLFAEPVGDRLIVTLFPQTGAISSHPVDVTDRNNNGVCDDPFRFAETGEVAGE